MRNNPQRRARSGIARAAGLVPYLLAALTASGIMGCGRSELTPTQTCQSHVYRLDDGRLLDIGPSSGDDLRWRVEDGRTGRLHADRRWASTLGWSNEPDGAVVQLPACGGADQPIGFSDRNGPLVSGHVVPLDSVESAFESHGTKLLGRLTMPAGTGAVPVVVEVHGSEKDSALQYNFHQRLLPAQNVGVFVYDKRGTGRSEGRYTQDFELLADDAAAAVAQARRLAAGRLLRLGLHGTSQGGWIAPLASTRATVDFIIVDFGLAGSVAEENHDQVIVELTRRGVTKPDLTAAADVADATSAVLASHFRGGYQRLDALRSQYRSEPWFKEIHGQFAGEMLKYPSWVLRLVGPLFEMGTPINYDAMAVLRRVSVPMLWVFAGDDTLAPNATTRARLSVLVVAGAPIEGILFPGTEHGIQEVVVAPDGTRTETRYAEGYFRTTIDFARFGHLNGSYGAGIRLFNETNADSGSAGCVVSAPRAP